MIYFCPQHIVDLFGSEESASTKGREAVLAWIKTLNVDYGDKVWIPEVGGMREMEKTDPRIQ